MYACTGSKQEQILGVVCNTLVQENVGMHNSIGFEICNSWYAYVPMAVC